MMGKRKLWQVFAAMVCLGVSYAAAKPDLDSLRVKSLYQSGDFEAVLGMLEPLMTDNQNLERAWTKPESLFIAKYLGVIYAANPVTREKGRYFLFRMLDLDSHAEIIDMFVGDEVDRAFEKVKKEHDLLKIDLTKKHLKPDSIAIASTSRMSSPSTSHQQATGISQQPQKSSSTKGTAKATTTNSLTKWVVWGSATLVGSAAVIAGYYWLSNSNENEVQPTEPMKVVFITPKP